MKNIFITGASGFVGKHLIDNLTKNQSFFVHTFLRTKNPKKHPSVHEISYGDIRNFESLRNAFLKGPIDTIIHLAAVIKPPKKEDYFTVNVKGTENLVRLAETFEVKRIIFLSTDVVLYNIAHPYKESKLQCEEIISRSNLDFIIFRPAPIYGSGDTKNFATLISLIKKWPLFPVVKCKMEPVYVGDVTKMILAAIEYPYNCRKIYNVPGGSFNEFSEIITTISRILKLKRLIVPIPKKIFLPLLKIYERIIPYPLLNSYQVEKWLQNKPLDVSDIKKDFDYHPLTFEEGMNLILKKP